MFHLGIDISKKTFDVALMKEDSKILHKKFTNNPKGFDQLLEWLKQKEIPSFHACMEATGVYWYHLARFLHEAGFRVSVLNPAQIKAFAQSELSRNKTDKLDASLIARFCKSQNPPPWSPPPPEFDELQALVRRLESLQGLEIQEKNRLETNPPGAVADSLKTVLQTIEIEIQRIKKLIQDHIDRHPNLKGQRDLLISIPGIGEITAANILAEIHDFKDFVSARHLAAYAGLNPRQHTSGTSVKKRNSLSKIGNARLRKCLYFPAITAKKHNPVIRKFCQNLKERGKNNMVVIGAAMRKLLHIIFGVLKSAKPFDPKFA